MESPRWSSQPFKGLFLTYQLFSTLFIRIPSWTLLAIPRSNRPVSSWPIHRVIGLRFIKHFLHIFSQVGSLGKIYNHLSISPAAGTEGVWIPPAPENLIAGEIKTLAETNAAKPDRIPGYWVHKKGYSIAWGAPPTQEEKVLLYFHGGAYVLMSGHPNDPAFRFGRGLLDTIPIVTRVFSVEYRLSQPGQNPFPAALLDAIAAYDYLVKVVGFLPENIIVAGESAGGNLSLALARYLVEYTGQEGIPAPPTALILSSPWSDIGASQLGRGASIDNLKTDYLESNGELLTYGKRVFCGDMGIDAAETNRWISPSSLDPRMVVDFKGFPRTFIVCGGGETLADTIRSLRDKMTVDLGDAVEYYEAPEAYHAYCLLDLQPETRETLAAIARWVAEDGSSGTGPSSIE